MEKNLVSIITPCLNGEKYLDRYFQSILAQTYRPLELIFVNDGSIDKTEEIAKSYEKQLKESNIKFVYLYQENAGQAVALNRGLKLFTGEYLTWPDSDDEMLPTCIEEKVKFLEENLEYGMVRCNGTYINQLNVTKHRICNKDDAKRENIFKDLLLLDTYGCCGCYMLKSSLFLDVYPNRLIFESRCGQNWQMLVPFASKTKCGYIDENLYNVYENVNSHSRNNNINQIKRWEDFTEIILECIKISDCDQEYFKNLVRENCARQQFYYAIQLKDKILIRNKFNEINRYGKASFKEFLIFIKKYVLEKK